MHWFKGETEDPVWNFTEQEDRPRYSEGDEITSYLNPVWNTDFTGNPITPNHDPCGYWFKGPIDVAPPSEPGVVILLTPQQNSPPDQGFVMMSYDTSTGQWTWLGDVLGEYPSGVPGTSRLLSTFSAYYGVISSDEVSDYTLSLYVFIDGVAHKYNMVSYVSSPRTQFMEGWEAVNCTMDANDEGLIVCLAFMYSDGGVTKNNWRVFRSLNKGVTWETPYNFPNAGTYGSGGAIRIDDTGVIWVSYVKVSTKELIVYKSTDNGASWSLVSTTLPSGTFIETIRFNYTVSSTGQYQYMLLYKNIALGQPYKQYIYSSSDFGVTFEEHYIQDDCVNCAHTCNNLTVVFINDNGDKNTMISSNGGVSFSSIPNNIWGRTADYATQQATGDFIAYTECNLTFDDAGYLSFSYSSDDGNTWTSIASPLLSGGYEGHQIIYDQFGVAHTYEYGWAQQSVDIRKFN